MQGVTCQYFPVFSNVIEKILSSFLLPVDTVIETYTGPGSEKYGKGLNLVSILTK